MRAVFSWAEREFHPLMMLMTAQCRAGLAAILVSMKRHATVVPG
jgi:hypothetical protein